MNYHSHKQKKELRLKLILFGIPLVVLSLAVLLYIVYGHRFVFFSRFMLFISAILVIIALLIIHVKYSLSKTRSKWKQFIMTAVVFSIFIAFAFGIVELKKSYDISQLKAYGKHLQGKVTDYETTYRKSIKYHYAIIQYNVEGEIYTKRISDENAFYQKGNDVELLVSEKDPDLFRVLNTYSDR